MKHIIYYNVQNGGDGSAHPKFFDSKKLAEWDEKQEEEGWGESSVGQLKIEAEGPIRVEDTETPISYLVELWRNRKWRPGKLEEFIPEFFPGGLPQFSTKEVPTDKSRYVEVYVGDTLVGEIFSKESAEEVEKSLNSLVPG